ncbi:MAG: KEOPS complex subunit Pcc1 [Candidatus Thermoplasmatota archaeon]|nr:KEOPS complex subunit Pcc1 [Candidatus Thermoplasmatota archaeon]MEE3030764.1 KEOPS complex subunit Pcc1 [Candidatus Thermoplasmatota archaeon]
MKSHEAVLSWAGKPSELEVLKASIEIDDPDSFDIIILNDRMEIRVYSTSLRSLRSTVDDILACLAAAESALNQVK